MLKAGELIKLIKEAKNSGVESISINKDGNISIKFLGQPASKHIEIKEDLEAMDQVAKTSNEEEDFEQASTNFNELDLIDPQAVEQLLQQGDLIEGPDGELIRPD